MWTGHSSPINDDEALNRGFNPQQSAPRCRRRNAKVPLRFSTKETLTDSQAVRAGSRVQDLQSQVATKQDRGCSTMATCSQLSAPEQPTQTNDDIWDNSTPKSSFLSVRWAVNDNLMHITDSSLHRDPGVT